MRVPAHSQFRSLLATGYVVALLLFWCPIEVFGDAKVTLEAGTEYDSNVHRFEDRNDPERPVSAAGLVRLGARVLGAHSRRRLTAAYSAFFGLKATGSTAGQTENALVSDFSGALQWRANDGVALAIGATLFDASNFRLGTSDGVAPRTFTSAQPSLRLELSGPNQHQLSVSASYRWFSFDLDRNFSWDGPGGALRYTKRFWIGDPDALDSWSIDLRLGYGATLRSFEGPAFARTCGRDVPIDPSCFETTAQARADLNHQVVAEAVITKGLLYSLRYQGQYNDSNSFGHSWVLQRLDLGVTSEVFDSGVFLTASGSVILNLFLDPLLLSRDFQTQTFVAVDEENRNALSLHASYGLSDSVSLEARYAFYSNQFASKNLNFSRHTLYTGLVYQSKP